MTYTGTPVSIGAGSCILTGMKRGAAFLLIIVLSLLWNDEGIPVDRIRRPSMLACGAGRTILEICVDPILALGTLPHTLPIFFRKSLVALAPEFGYAA